MRTASVRRMASNKANAPNAPRNVNKRPATHADWRIRSYPQVGSPGHVTVFSSLNSTRAVMSSPVTVAVLSLAIGLAL